MLPAGHERFKPKKASPQVSGVLPPAVTPPRFARTFLNPPAKKGFRTWSPPPVAQSAALVGELALAPCPPDSRLLVCSTRRTSSSPSCLRPPDPHPPRVLFARPEFPELTRAQRLQPLLPVLGARDPYRAFERDPCRSAPTIWGRPVPLGPLCSPRTGLPAAKEPLP